MPDLSVAKRPEEQPISIYENPLSMAAFATLQGKKKEFSSSMRSKLEKSGITDESTQNTLIQSAFDDAMNLVSRGEHDQQKIEQVIAKNTEERARQIYGGLFQDMKQLFASGLEKVKKVPGYVVGATEKLVAGVNQISEERKKAEKRFNENPIVKKLPLFKIPGSDTPLFTASDMNELRQVVSDNTYDAVFQYMTTGIRPNEKLVERKTTVDVISAASKIISKKAAAKLPKEIGGVSIPERFAESIFDPKLIEGALSEYAKIPGHAGTGSTVALAKRLSAIPGYVAGERLAGLGLSFITPNDVSEYKRDVAGAAFDKTKEKYFESRDIGRVTDWLRGSGVEDIDKYATNSFLEIVGRHASAGDVDISDAHVLVNAFSQKNKTPEGIAFAEDLNAVIKTVMARTTDGLAVKKSLNEIIAVVVEGGHAELEKLKDKLTHQTPSTIPVRSMRDINWENYRNEEMGQRGWEDGEEADRLSGGNPYKRELELAKLRANREADLWKKFNKKYPDRPVVGSQTIGPAIGAALNLQNAEVRNISQYKTGWGTYTADSPGGMLKDTAGKIYDSIKSVLKKVPQVTRDEFTKKFSSALLKASGKAAVDPRPKADFGALIHAYQRAAQGYEQPGDTYQYAPTLTQQDAHDNMMSLATAINATLKMVQNEMGPEMVLSMRPEDLLSAAANFMQPIQEAKDTRTMEGLEGVAAMEFGPRRRRRSGWMT
jgi:hypothetical protein